MGQVSQDRDRDVSRMRWNDIRIVGPALVLALLAAVLISPQFSSADQSVGFSIRDRCFETDAFAQPAVGVILSPECCLDPSVVGGFLPICPPPEPPAEVQPLSELVPPPDPIIGPIWLGAINADVAGGVVTLKPPVLLGLFIKNNHVKVTDSDGDVVFYGPMSGQRIVFLDEGGTYTVETVLVTGAKYTEVVSTGSDSVS